MKEQGGKLKVLIGPSSFAAKDKTPMERLISAGFEVIDNPFKRKLTKNELLGLLSNDVVGIVAGLEPLDREVMQRSRLKVISRAGSGLSNVDLDSAKEFGIKVCSTPNGPTEAVAELTLGAMLALIRMVPEMDRGLRDGKWPKKIGHQLEGKTVAIIGFGRIGRRVAELLSPFYVKNIIVDPLVTDTIIGVPPFFHDDVRLEKNSLEEALGRADIITIHSSGDKQIIGEREFSLMKDGVFLLNAARGSLISEPALIKALETGKVGGAWLDVFTDEPYKGALCKFSNVILTPHVGSYTEEGRSKMEMEAVENLINALKGNS